MGNSESRGTRRQLRGVRISPVRIITACIIVLFAVTVGAALAGHGYTASRWGDDGIRSMYAVGAICLGAAVAAFLPVALVASRWPGQIGNAAIAATAIRLLLTMSAAGIYQVIYKPHLTSFLFWAVIYYCLLLAVETGFNLLLVRRHYRNPLRSNGGQAAHRLPTEFPA